ncbi:MAG: type IV secretory system conjugative DNA transfer family protein [Candidatus Paceibacterota bacterium]
MKKEITPIGKTNFRDEQKRFGIKVDDRRRHIYIVGKTGVGKSTLIENMAISDIEQGRGVGIIDPHGELAEKLLEFIPEERLEDVIYFDPSDTNHPMAFNPLEQVSGELRHLIASSMMGVFKKIWPDVWSARMEYILNNTLLALLEYPGATLVGILRMFSDKEYRKKVVEGLEDPVVKHFWANEFASYSQRYQVEAVGAIQNKVGQFVTNPLIRNILGQPRSSIDMKKIMDEEKILIVNLSKGKIGEDNASLLGAMMVTRLQLAAMSRAKDLDKDYKDFYLYVDEFQNFATDSFATILSEARKYRLSLTLAHQYISQLVSDGNTKVRDAIFGNVGTLVSFRIGANDAEFLEKEFSPEYDENDLVNLPKFHILIKLMIDGVASKPFSAATLEPREPLSEASDKETIIEYSRKKYASRKDHVERGLRKEWINDDAVDQKKISKKEESLEKALSKPEPPKTKKDKHKNKSNVDIGGLKNLIEDALKEASKDDSED